MHDIGVGTARIVMWCSETTRPYLAQVAIAITSSLLAVFGSDIHGWFKDLVKQRHFIVRVAAFVALVAFGYGALNLVISHLLARVLMQANDLYLFPSLLVIFGLIGFLAEERKQI